MAIPTYVAQLGQATNNAFHDPLTISSVTVSAGTNRMLVVSVSVKNNSNEESVSTVTFNGSEALTQQATIDNQGVGAVHAQEIWTLKDPTVTTADVVVDYTNNMRTARATAHQYNGVDAVGATATNSGVSADPTVSVTTTRVDSKVFGGFFVDGGDTDPFTPGTGVTERNDGATGTGAVDVGFFDGDRDAAATGSFTINATAAVSDDWGICAIELMSPVGGANPKGPLGMPLHGPIGGPI